MKTCKPAPTVAIKQERATDENEQPEEEQEDVDISNDKDEEMEQQNQKKKQDVHISVDEVPTSVWEVKNADPQELREMKRIVTADENFWLSNSLIWSLLMNSVHLQLAVNVNVIKFEIVYYIRNTNWKDEKDANRTMRIFNEAYPKWKELNGLFFTMNTELPTNSPYNGSHWFCMAVHFSKKKARLRRSKRHKNKVENVDDEIIKMQWYIFDAYNQPKLNMSGKIQRETIKPMRTFLTKLFPSQTKIPTKPKQIEIIPKQTNCWDCGLYPPIILEQFNDFAINAVDNKNRMPKVQASITELKERRNWIKNKVVEQFEQVTNAINGDAVNEHDGTKGDQKKEENDIEMLNSLVP